MTKHPLIFLFFIVSCGNGALMGGDFYVSPQGSDHNPGTKSLPFKTIQKAADTARAGDICHIAGGRYRETVELTNSGRQDKPIVFRSAEGEKVVIDGTDPVATDWTPAGKAYTTRLPEPAEQLFYKYRAMVPARWPNMLFEENWIDHKKWGRTEEGSDRGKVVSQKLAALGAGLEGASVYIKLGKGNACYRRDIVKHAAGSEAFYWDDKDFYDNPAMTGEDGLASRIEKMGLQNNRFFVSNHRALLDAQQEWFYDTHSGELLFIPPEDEKPAPGDVSVKRRTYGLKGDRVENIELHGIKFFACTLGLTQARRIVVEECSFLHPFELWQLHDNQQIGADERPVFIQGEDCRLCKCLVKYSTGSSILVRGRGNRIENCVVAEGSRHGSHSQKSVTIHYDHRDFYPGADGALHARWEYTSTAGNTVSRSSVYNCGSVGIYLLGAGPATAEYNHVFNVGMYCSDVSSIYAPLGRNRQWTGYHHNWLHDVNGLGFRCDQDGEQMIFHHNVVWNCKVGGKANGYDFRLFHNTVFIEKESKADGFAFVLQEKKDPKSVMTDWPVQNNVFKSMVDRQDLKERAKDPALTKIRRFAVPLPDSPAIHHNYLMDSAGYEDLFVSTNSEAMDLRPANGSPLVDAGVVVDGFDKEFKGAAPDIGAYEYGGEYWAPGADWLPDGLTPPKTMPDATRLAHELLGDVRLYREDAEQYNHQ